jgi:thymidylate synthase
MEQYHNLLKDILKNGEEKDDRTGVGTYSVFGRQLRFNLQEGFPAITTKKLAWKACAAELLWFIEGSGDERRLAELTHGTRDISKTTIWTGNAQAPYWTPKAKYDGDLGRVYGVQWRDWLGKDQLMTLVDGLKNDPTGRRHILTAWNVAELDQMALPPCHVMSQYYVSKSGKLSCHMYQRSVDVFLGLPFNIASYALLTHLLAHVCGYEVGELIISTGDTHIYKNHVDQVNEQLAREAFANSTLWLNSEVKEIDKFTMTDIKLVGYESHGTIKADMAV